MAEHVCGDEPERLLASSFSLLTVWDRCICVCVRVKSSGTRNLSENLDLDLDCKCRLFPEFRFQNSCVFKPIVILKYSVIVVAEVWAFERAHVLCMRVEGGASDCWTEMLQKAPSVTVPPLYPLCFSLQLQPCRFLIPPTFPVHMAAQTAVCMHVCLNLGLYSNVATLFDPALETLCRPARVLEGLLVVWVEFNLSAWAAIVPSGSCFVAALCYFLFWDSYFSRLGHKLLLIALIITKPE